jgi:hypothetical protein
MLRKNIARVAVVVMAATGVGFLVNAPSAVAKKCNPNINGEVNSGHGEQGNDDKSCPTTASTTAPSSAVVIQAVPAAPAPPAAPSPARPTAAPALPVTAQPRTTG